MVFARSSSPSRAACALLIASLSLSPCLAQSPFAPVGQEIRFAFAEQQHLGKTGLRLATGPYPWAAAAVVGLAFAHDEPIRDWVQDHKSPAGDSYFGYMHQFGEWDKVLLFETGLYAAGWLTGSDPVRDLGRAALQASILSGTVTNLLKATVARGRPFLEQGPYTRNTSGLHEEPWKSFPSADAAMSASLFGALAGRAESPWMRAVFFAASGSVAFGRMYHDWHWASDVSTSFLFSSFIGYTLGARLRPESRRSRMEKPDKGSAAWSANLELTPIADGMGMTLRWPLPSVL